MTKYIIRAALRDESNDGWLWTRGFGSRTVVRIVNFDGSRRVYCQAREIDTNFLKQYNDSSRIHITCQPTIVMGQWYRDALGGFETTQRDNKTALVELHITPYEHRWNRWWGSLRAAAQHPDIVVRIGTTLGVLGFAIGLVGLFPSLAEMITANLCIRALIIFGGAAVVVIAGICACVRPKLSRPRQP